MCTATTVVVIAKYVTVVCLIYSVIRLPLHRSAHYIFRQSFCTGIFCLTHRPPNYIWPCYQNSNVTFNSSKLLYRQLQGLCGALTTEQLSIASVFASGVNATAH